MWLDDRLGVRLPIVQAPMAGAQGATLAVAVSEAGGLGALPCALLTPEAMRRELLVIRAGPARPYNVNFLCSPKPRLLRYTAPRLPARMHATQLSPTCSAAGPREASSIA